MDRLLDELARSLAGPLPRRDALKVLGTALVGSIVGAFNSVVHAQAVCSPACSGNKYCCQPAQSGFPAFCVTIGKTCCGDDKCSSNKQCCPSIFTGLGPFCATQGKECCGSDACSSNKYCCTPQNLAFPPFCVTVGKTCCGEKKCSADKICCDDGTKPFCASAGKICCGNKTCGKDQCCYQGRCVASTSSSPCPGQ